MKLKTVKSAKKRILNITKNNKLIRRKASAQHLVAGKSKRTISSARKTDTIAPADARNIRKMLPYG